MSECTCESCALRRALERTRRTVNELRAKHPCVTCDGTGWQTIRCRGGDIDKRLCPHCPPSRTPLIGSEAKMQESIDQANNPHKGPI